MDLFDQLRAFVATARCGSFTAAAEELGTSNRLTSKYVAELEQRLGVRLLQRTTRQVGLSPAGETLLAGVPALLDGIDDLLEEVSQGSEGLSGPLRITAPVTFGEIYVAGMLARFGTKYPDLTIDLRLSDTYADLASEGIDLALRIGHFDLSSMKVRRLTSFESILVASPAFLAQSPEITKPEDLSEVACIVDTNRRFPRRWNFTRVSEERVVQVKGRFQVNSAHAAAELARQGLGVAYIPSFAVSDAIEGGALVPLLAEWTGEKGDVAAVYLEGRALPRKVRTLIDFIVADIGGTSF